MSVLARHSRSLFIAIVAVAVSAGLAVAAGPVPEASDHSITPVTQAAVKNVPVGRDVADAGVAEEPAVEPAASVTNHGALVAEAAHMTTPDGFSNHGEFVSCVAHVPHDKPSAGSEGAAPLSDLTTLTPEDCRAAREAAREVKEAERGARAGERAGAKAERKAALADRRSPRAHGGNHQGGPPSP